MVGEGGVIMKILNKKKMINFPLNCKCHSTDCQCEVELDKNDIYTDSDGDSYWTCPWCGDSNYIDSLIKFDYDEDSSDDRLYVKDAKYPYDYYTFGNSEDAYHISNDEINERVKECAKHINNDGVDNWSIASGDTLVRVFKEEEDGSLNVLVCKNYSEGNFKNIIL